MSRYVSRRTISWSQRMSQCYTSSVSGVSVCWCVAVSKNVAASHIPCVPVCGSVSHCVSGSPCVSQYVAECCSVAACRSATKSETIAVSPSRANSLQMPTSNKRVTIVNISNRTLSKRILGAFVDRCGRGCVFSSFLLCLLYVLDMSCQQM